MLSKVDRSQKLFDLHDEAFFRGKLRDFQSCAVLGSISPHQGDTMSKKVTKVFGLIIMRTLPLSVGKSTFQRHVFAKSSGIGGWSIWHLTDPQAVPVTEWGPTRNAEVTASFFSSRSFCNFKDKWISKNFSFMNAFMVWPTIGTKILSESLCFLDLPFHIRKTFSFFFLLHTIFGSRP